MFEASKSGEKVPHVAEDHRSSKKDDSNFSLRGFEIVSLGRLHLIPARCEPKTVKAGDFVTFPDGMTCIWDVSKPIKKHFNFI